MKIPSLVYSFFAVLASSFSLHAGNEHVLQYDKAGMSWQMDALPIGNGRMGAKIFSGVDAERIHFNEDSLWENTTKNIASFQSFGDIHIYFKERSYVDTHQYSLEDRGLLMAFDGNKKTYWEMKRKGSPTVSAPYILNIRTPLSEGALITQYSLETTVQLKKKRNKSTVGHTPKTWRLEGSADGGKTWVLIDRRKDEKEWNLAGESRTYKLKNTKKFNRHRLVIEKTHNGEENIQLAEIDFPELNLKEETPSKYRRELNIANAVHKTQYTRGGINYQRESFASYPDDLMVFHFTADKKSAYSCQIDLRCAHGNKSIVSGNNISFSGQTEATKSVPFSNKYEAQMRVLHKGGKLRSEGGKIFLDKVDSFTILLAPGTDFLANRDKEWRKEHPHEGLLEILNKAEKKSFEELRERHIKDYQNIFAKASIDLGETSSEQSSLPTDKRLSSYENDVKDPDFEELMFNYARYLLIACSRDNGNAANLQGLWNDSNKPAWQSDYHPDVNIQMNYWFVDAANLSECFSPFAKWMDSIRSTRREDTKKNKNYKNVRGWSFRTGTDIYGNSLWEWMSVGAAWCAQNLWDHYAFTQDKAYLESVYPILKELCEFWEDQLKELPDGTLVAPNGWSPERGPRGDGVSHEQQLIRDLFGNYAEAAKVLGRDEDFRKKVLAMRGKLLGHQIGKWGQLQEWMKDLDNKGDKHRHLSHLMAVHPCNQISPLTTPKLAEAAKVSLNARKDAGPGWSKAQKVCLWARLHDGNRCHKLIREHMILLENSRLLMDGGGFFPNLTNGAPIQLEANWGYAAGVCEMLIQSHMGNEIHLLPALADIWKPKGSFKGLKSRGNYEINMQWQDGNVTQGQIISRNGGTCIIRTHAPIVAKLGQQIIKSKSDPKHKGHYLTTLKSKAGDTWEIRKANQ